MDLRLPSVLRLLVTPKDQTVFPDQKEGPCVCKNTVEGLRNWRPRALRGLRTNRDTRNWKIFPVDLYCPWM